jgi:hypothetical protein
MYARRYGFKNPYAAYQTELKNIPCKAQEVAQTWIDACQHVMNNKQQSRHLSIVKRKNDRWDITTSLITAVRNRKGEIIGTYTLLSDPGFDVLPLISLLSVSKESQKAPPKLTQGTYPIGSPANQINLSGLEHPVLFLMLRKYEKSKIEEILNIPRKILDCIIDSLEHKFCCFSRRNLITKAIWVGYLNIIPEYIFRHQIVLKLAD